MQAEQEFKKIMAAQTEMALATTAKGTPNVRIVNFIYDENKKIVYFATFKDNAKVREIAVNPHVAFTTIPREGNAHVKAKGVASKSGLAIYDVVELFTAKIPGYRQTIEQVGPFLVLYEIQFQEAVVTLDLDNIVTVTI